MNYFHSYSISKRVEESLQAIQSQIIGLDASVDDYYISEHRLEDTFLVDYYIPQARLVFEINGKDHFYPYTYKKNNVTNLKSKLLREWWRSTDDANNV